VLTLSVGKLAELDFAAAALAEAALAPACIEVLWDNYCHLDPGALAGYLARLSDRVALNVMWSQFLERDAAAWASYLARLRQHVRVLRPIAVSDHLCRFRSHGNHALAIPQEHDYADLDHVCARVAQYQDAIGQPLLVENFASTDAPAERQLAFLDRLVERTGCGILFDVSNAVVGELNGLGDVALWMRWLAGRSLRLHVGSYVYNERTGLHHDTHSTEVSALSIARLAEVIAATEVLSITFERDHDKTVAGVARDLRRIAEVLP
jgi:uncharacterized protein (UPF0276 family)